MTVRAKKKFGQNFLRDGAALQRIAELVLEDSKPGTRLLEIGAGTGHLTKALVEAIATSNYPERTLTSLEIDRDLVPILQSREDLSSVTIVEADALTFDYTGFTRVVGNLPYNIATPLLLKFIEMENGPEVIVAMIQKDVADRLAAVPATPAYGSLSIAVQYAMHIECTFTLPPAAFHPRPKVDSTVVRLQRREHPAVTPRDLARFWQVVRAAFAYRRKTLANSLALALDRPRTEVARAIAAAHLEPEIRGEQLNLDDFAKLADTLATQRI